jgi:hypothetical protein
MTRDHSRPVRALATAVAAVVAALALAPAVAAAGNDQTRLIVSLSLANTRHHNFLGQLQYNCDLFFSNGLVPEGNPLLATAAGPPVGSLDFARGRGEAFVKRNNWQVEALPPSHARPALFANMGIALRGRTVFLTARVTHGRSMLGSARRQRLAMIRRAKIESGTLLDQHGRTAPNTFSFIASGRLRMLSAMSRALERTRCKNRRRNPASRRLKPGYDLGTLTVGLRPDKAAGLAGDVKFKPFATARGEEADQPVTMQPGAGVRQDSKRNLIAPMTSGLPVPLACEAGGNCTPSGGGFGLGGGFDLVLGSRRTSVASIVVSTTGTAPDSLAESITGTLDGAPVTIAQGGFVGGFGFTEDFEQRAGAALGTPITGGLDMQPRFTRTGPAG